MKVTSTTAIAAADTDVQRDAQRARRLVNRLMRRVQGKGFTLEVGVGRRKLHGGYLSRV